MSERTKIPEWKRFMANVKNKTNLLNFIGESWMNENGKIPEGMHLIIGGVFKNPGRTVAITSTYCQEILELARSVHEEADTRLFVHLNYNVCTVNCNTGVICCIDTDVIVVAMYCCVRMPVLTKLWIQKDDTYLPLHSIVLYMLMHTHWNGKINF